MVSSHEQRNSGLSVAAEDGWPKYWTSGGDARRPHRPGDRRPGEPPTADQRDPERKKVVGGRK